jgi:dihydrolipoamide dehydrogenase
MVMGEMEMSCELLVLGGGVGAYSAAFRADELGLDVIVVEPPGTSADLLIDEFAARTALEFLYRNQDQDQGQSRLELLQKHLRTVLAHANSRQDERKKRASILWVEGKTMFTDANTVRITGAEITRIRFEKAIIASGKKSSTPRSEAKANSKILSQQSALQFAALPQKLCVIGGATQSFAIASLYAQLGSTVTLVEPQQGLVPGMDPRLLSCPSDRFTGNRGKFFLAPGAENITEQVDGIEVIFPETDSQSLERFDALVTGESHFPNTDGLHLIELGIKTNATGHVMTNDSLQSTIPHIFAIGETNDPDCPPAKADLQGRIVADIVKGLPSGMDAQIFPYIMPSFPPVGWCGMTEKQAKEHGLDVASVVLPWEDLTEAAIIGCTDGSTILLAERATGRIIGGGAFGFFAELILAEMTVAIECGALAEDLAIIASPQASMSQTIRIAAQQLLPMLQVA